MNVYLIATAEPIPSDGVRPMRYMGLAAELVRAGHTVTFITTSFFHFTKTQRFQSDTVLRADGYTVRALRSWGYRRNVSLWRYIAHRQFAGRLRDTLRQLPAADLIMVALPPLDTAQAAVDVGRAQGVPVVVDIIDPWPDAFASQVPEAFGFLVRWITWPLRRQLKAIIGSASAVTAISDTYLQWAFRHARTPLPGKAFYPAVTVPVSTPVSKASDASRPLRFVYAGSLGSNYDVMTIVACAQTLAREGFTGAEFVIAGAGPASDRIREVSASCGNVRFCGWLNAAQLAEQLDHSDVAIAAYVRRATQSVTYKLFDYLSAGLPILCSLRGEMSEILEENEVGIYYEAENPEALAHAVRSLCDDRARVARMQTDARKFARDRGTVSEVYGQAVRFLEQQAGCRSAQAAV